MKLIHFVETFQLVIGVTVTLLYLYQVAYLVVGLLRRRWQDHHQPSRLRRYAVLISARNEEGVISELIGSLKKQNYPAELLEAEGLFLMMSGGSWGVFIIKIDYPVR